MSYSRDETNSPPKICMKINTPSPSKRGLSWPLFSLCRVEFQYFFIL